LDHSAEHLLCIVLLAEEAPVNRREPGLPPNVQQQAAARQRRLE
jgi:hypothetical protein